MTGVDVRPASASSNGDAAPGSVLAGLRQQARQQRERAHLDLVVGGAFGDRLAVRYGLLPVEELERYSELTGQATNLSLAIDMMVSTAQTLLWREHDQETDLGVRIGSELWELMDWPLPAGVDSPQDITPREVVTALFGDNALALGAHVEELVAWMQNPQHEGTPGGS